METREEQENFYNLGVLMTFVGLILTNVFFSGTVVEKFVTPMAAMSLAALNLYGYSIGHKFLYSKNMHLGMCLAWFVLAVSLFGKMLLFGL